MELSSIVLGVFFAIWVITIGVLSAACYGLWRRELIADARRFTEHQRLHDFYREALKQIGATVTFGTPTPSPAVVTESSDPERDLRARISDETMAEGVRALRRDYEAMGVKPPTDEELMAEVRSIVAGFSPEPVLMVPVRD